MIGEKLSRLLFPPKCILCQKVLPDETTDLCHSCRADTESFPKPNYKISFVAGWSALWYYIGNVRHSMLLFKFYSRRNYGTAYGRILAMKLLNTAFSNYDILTWVPISPQRKWRRGYDQVEVIALSLGQELGTKPMKVLKKIRHTKPQSRIRDYARRKANVLGAFAVTDPKLVAGKRILLIDDIITTGATVSECARVLLTAGAKEVNCAAVAALNKEKRR